MQMSAGTSEPVPIKRVPSSSSDYCGDRNSVESALEDLESKYTCVPTDLEPCISFLSSSPPKGECLRRLRTVVLSNTNISEVGDPSHITETLKNVKELDLSHNQIRDWDHIGRLLKALPKLKALDISFNPLKARLEPDFLDSEHGLEVLALNGVKLTVDSLNTILVLFPNLRVLQLCAIPLSSQIGIKSEGKENGLTFPDPAHSLKQLHLENCQLNCWSIVTSFTQQFGDLETLGLAHNEIAEIEADCKITGKSIAELFPKLRILCLNGCPLRSWESIDALASLPSLEDLRVRQVPMLDELECDLKHQLLIPRIPNLKMLNGSEITPRYREDCERAFIRFYQKNSNKPSIYDHLVEVHGDLEQLVCVDLTPQETVRTLLRCDEKNLKIYIKHRLHMTVTAFLRSLCKFTEMKLKDLRVLHVTPQFPARCPEELRPSNQFLHTLKVEDGDEFHCFSKR